MIDKNLPFHWQKARGASLPILVSVPHSGTEFPEDLEKFFKEKFRKDPEDTDWLVHKVYDFLPSLGIPVLHAKYSRYVVDLNRDPDDVALYNDDRFITGLFPTHSFTKEALYKDKSTQEEALSEFDRKWRMDRFYWPYYRAIQSHLTEKRDQHKAALLFDAHSIARSVPSLSAEPFPDLVLGTQMGFTADKKLIDAALEVLERSPYKVSHNDPFRGGNITRNHGNPEMGFHAMQLEMCQDLYLAEDGRSLDPEKTEQLRNTLSLLFRELEDAMNTL